MSRSAWREDSSRANAHLALVDEIRERLHNLAHRHLCAPKSGVVVRRRDRARTRVIAVRVDDVDVLETEPLETGRHALDDVLPAETARVRRRPAGAKVDLRGEAVSAGSVAELGSRARASSTLVAMVISSRFQPSSLMIRPSSSSDWPFAGDRSSADTGPARRGAHSLRYGQPAKDRRPLWLTDFGRVDVCHGTSAALQARPHACAQLMPFSKARRSNSLAGSPLTVPPLRSISALREIRRGSARRTR